MQPMTQTVVVREDLALSTSEVATHVSKASLYANDRTECTPSAHWKAMGSPLTIRAAMSSYELISMRQIALQNDIPYSLVNDQTTSVSDREVVAIGLGPAPHSRIEAITDQYPLYEESSGDSIETEVQSEDSVPIRQD